MHISSLLWGRWHKQRLAAGWWWGKVEAVNSQGGKMTQSWVDKGWGCSSVFPMASLCSLFLPAIVCIWLRDIGTPHFFCPKLEPLLGVAAAGGDLLVGAYSALLGLLNLSMVSLYQYSALTQQLTGETQGVREQFWCISTTCFGFALGVEHWGILSGWLHWSYGRGMRLEHITRNCKTLRHQERLLTKSSCVCRLTEALRQGSPAWVCRATAVTEKKLCWTQAVAAEAPDLGAQIHHHFSQYWQPLLLWSSLPLPPSLTWWWLVTDLRWITRVGSSRVLVTSSLGDL